MTNQPLDRLAPDGYVAERMTYYAALYPRLREVARQRGYALALHGSLKKDLDVLAAPWTEDATDAWTLAHALCEAASGMIEPRTDAGQSPMVKPHGRLSWTIHLGRDGGYIDLSVMPRDRDVIAPRPASPGGWRTLFRTLRAWTGL